MQIPIIIPPPITLPSTSITVPVVMCIELTTVTMNLTIRMSTGDTHTVWLQPMFDTYMNMHMARHIEAYMNQRKVKIEMLLNEATAV